MVTMQSGGINLHAEMDVGEWPTKKLYSSF